MRTTLGILLASILFSGNTYQLISPKPKFRSVSGDITLNLPDSTLKLGTRVVLSGFVIGDTIRYTYYKNDSAIFVHRSKALRDSTTTPAPAYNTGAIYKGCAQVERNGRASGIVYPAVQSCWTFPYLRPAPIGTMDSIVQITLRPLGPSLIEDSGAVCVKWQAANPSKSPFITVNVKAVPQCERDNKLVVWQYCTFAALFNGRMVKMKNSWNIPFCDVEYQSWLNEKAL